MKYQIKQVEGLYYLCSKNKGADQLICAFVFAFAKSRFSHDTVHMRLNKSESFYAIREEQRHILACTPRLADKCLHVVLLLRWF